MAARKPAAERKKTGPNGPMKPIRNRGQAERRPEMTDEELIARLRAGPGHDRREAADRIEALVKERDQWIEHTKNAVWTDSEELKLANVRAERLEAALRNCPPTSNPTLSSQEKLDRIDAWWRLEARALLDEIEGAKK